MNTKSKSTFDTAFFIRMGVLLVLLLGIGGAFAYDRLVLVPGGKDAVERVLKACEGFSADRAAVLEAAGCEPSKTENVGGYQIDDWHFSRILPNLEGYKVSVVYNQDKVSEYYRGGISDTDRAALDR